MKTVKVIYTARPAFVAQNQQNIKQVMSDLQKLNASIHYTVCLGADGKTFTHLAFFETEEDHKVLMQLPSFNHFQAELKAKGLETPPQQELLEVVGSSKLIF
jgi:hypothetical protein